jgi:hypothetical protein
MRSLIENIESSLTEGEREPKGAYIKRAVDAALDLARYAKSNMSSGNNAEAYSDLASLVMTVLDEMYMASKDKDLKRIIKLSSDVLTNTNLESVGSDSDIEEGISEGAVYRLVEAMFRSPRVESMLKRFGVSGGDITRLEAKVVPVIKLWFGGIGKRVAGASAAKAAVRQMAKG